MQNAKRPRRSERTSVWCSARSWPRHSVSREAAIAVDDSTQDYIEGSDGGWGVLGNPDRVDRCLVFWAKYIDDASVETYKSQQTTTQGPENAIGVGDGLGLANTDKSRFVIDYGVDGHNIFYMLPIVRSATEPAGAEGDMYYNTTDLGVYLHDGTSFNLLLVSDLPNIEGNAGITVCEDIFDLNVRKALGVKTNDLDNVHLRNVEDKEKEIREIRNKILMWRSQFKEGKQPTARKNLKTLEDVL